MATPSSYKEAVATDLFDWAKVLFKTVKATFPLLTQHPIKSNWIFGDHDGPSEIYTHGNILSRCGFTVGNLGQPLGLDKEK